MPTTPTDVHLPSQLPVVPGAVLHGTYVLTDREPINRGDTLDAVVLPDHCLALFVADVVGHGFQASMAATQVRTVLRERLLAGAGLTGAAEALDAYLRRVADIGAVSTCVVVVDPVDGRSEYVTMGHVGPVIAHPDGSTWRPAAHHPHPPLGSGSAPERAAPARFVLPEGDLLLLATNGLLPDAEGDHVLAAGDRLGRSGDPAARIDGWCADLLGSLVPDDGLADDGVLLAALRMEDALPLSLSLPASRSSVVEVRNAVDQWLDAVGAGLLDHAGLVQALDEITTNVVEHAYCDAPGSLQAGAELEPTGRALVTVADDGVWEADAPSGLGLTIAAGLADELSIDRGAEGNEVRLRHELSRPVAMYQTLPARPRPDWDAEMTVDSGPGIVVVAGAVDDIAAEVFHTALNEKSEAGTRDLTVDLTAVTRLASPGVQTLHELRRHSGAAGRRVDVVARAGSCVARVLAITAVPHRTVG